MIAAAAASEALLEMKGQKLGNRSRKSSENAGDRAVDCQFMFQTLHAPSQDGLSLEFVAATTGKEWNIQDERGIALCTVHDYTVFSILDCSTLYSILFY